MADFPAVYGAQQAIYPVSFLHVAARWGSSGKFAENRVNAANHAFADEVSLLIHRSPPHSPPLLLLFSALFSRADP